MKPAPDWMYTGMTQAEWVKATAEYHDAKQALADTAAGGDQ